MKKKGDGGKRKGRNHLPFPIILPSKKGNNMIILFSKKSNTKIENNLKKYEDTANFYDMRCPNCGSDGLIKWGSYTRNIQYIDGELTSKVLIVKRVRCKKCGKTHALLPSFIIPYKISLLDVILSSLNDEDITLSISIDTINVWRKAFKIFLPYLKTLFNNRNTYEIITLFKNKIFEYYELFYERFKKILMMTHKGILLTAYF